MRDEPALDAAGIEKQRQAAAFGVPELGVHVQEDAVQRLARARLLHTDAAAGGAFSHRLGKAHVQLEQVEGRDLDIGVNRHNGGGCGHLPRLAPQRQHAPGRKGRTRSDNQRIGAPLQKRETRNEVDAAGKADEAAGHRLDRPARRGRRLARQHRHIPIARVRGQANDPQAELAAVLSPFERGPKGAGQIAAQL